MNMEIILYLAFFVFGYYIATFVFTYQLKKALEKILDTNDSSTDQCKITASNGQPIALLTIENINNSFFIYDNNNNFVCQGLTLDDAAYNLLEHKKIKFAIGSYNDKTVYFKEGKVLKAQ